MRLFINSLAASAGGGLTYIRNVLPVLAIRPEVTVTVAASAGVQQEFGAIPSINFVGTNFPSGRRFWYEQFVLPRIIRQSRTEVLLSAGNFALTNSPVPQILLSRNSIYTSKDFYRDLLARHEYRTWVDTRIRAVIAKASVNWADVTISPSESFAAELRRWTGASDIVSVHHGFDREAFVREKSPLTAEVERKLHGADDSLKLLFVSHYNYYRNFETLIRALPHIRDRLDGRRVQLLLTCKLASGENPGSYHPESAAKLIKELGVSDMVIQLGAIPYAQLHQVYSRANIYVTPAYTETFAHPLVEAMSFGLPIVASDLPVHREICDDAALYFSRFSERELADRLADLVSAEDLGPRLGARGVQRSSSFSWNKHVDELIAVASSLAGRSALQPQVESRTR